MAITAGNDILASDFVSSSSGAGDSGKVAKLNSSGQIPSAFIPFLIGEIKTYAGRTAPTNFAICDGSAISRATYAALFAIVSPVIGTFTVTLASPAVFTLNSHGLQLGDAVYLTTSGALPTGLSANTIYYVISAGLTTNAFELSASLGGAAINTSGSQSGTHTLTSCPFGLGDGSTTFNIPDLRQRVPVGFKSGDTYHGALGANGGEQTHALTVGELAAHHHQYPGVGGGGSNPSLTISTALGANVNSSDTGSGTPHNNLQPFLTVNYIIRLLD